MLYILDDDQFNLIGNNSVYSFLLESNEFIRYYKFEDQIDFNIEDFASNDYVCYHNSFPCDKTLITNRLVEANDNKRNFTLICFSAAADFHNLQVEDKFIKIHKDRFYDNLKLFIDSGFDLRMLLYGQNSDEAELAIIQNRINNSLFSYSKSAELPIKELIPKDLKRICELKGVDYTKFISEITELSVEGFKKYINNLVQSR